MDLLKKEQEGIEYTEAIRNTLDEKAGREIIIGKQPKGYIASILYDRGGPVEAAPGDTVEQAIRRVFTCGQPAWYREAITFHNKHGLERMQTLIELYGQLRFKLRHGKVQIYLGEEKDPIDGDYGHIQEALRYAIIHSKKMKNN
jgi:hypothetical protein